MKLPKSIVAKITNAKKLSIENLDQMDYGSSVAIAQKNSPKNPTSLYTHYFKAEQESNLSEKEKLFQVAGAKSKNEEMKVVFQIIQGRRLLETENAGEGAITGWFDQTIKNIPQRLSPYVHFLTGTAFLNIDLKEKADFHFAKSASLYFKFGAHERELVSHLHRPSLTSDDLILLRSYSENDKNSKCHHIANFELARRFHQNGDQEQAIRFSEKAYDGFSYDFIDPRRKRIASKFLLKLRNITLTPLEMHLSKILKAGPKTKSELLLELFGNSQDVSMLESMDSRFRSLIYRMNKKSSAKVIKVGDKYLLNFTPA